ncbi:MAG: protein kinase [Bryobacteraceae bacterium]
MPANQVIGKRYEVQYPPIGQGGMGVVYKAYDSVTRRFVALKTLRGGVDQSDLQLFEKEWTVLARISHPNIVDILDTGDFIEDGRTKPYFVMPLLPGTTLDQLVHDRSQRLTVQRTVEIICQACRGLQAAHDQGLVHRDLKPSNIFVMEDDAVKIIDFGVVHLADTRSFTGIKGTLDYMAPEQLQLKAATPQSDIFSLGVVAYEALTGQRPFAQFTGSDLIEAIRTFIPPPATELNPSVNPMVSRTIHKAMAKQPYHRYASAREFADTLQKAMRNEPIERFEPSQIQPRIERIKKALQEGDCHFAQEILTELESEGHIEPDMPALRSAIDIAVRDKAIRELLESARTRFEEEEYPLALQKVQEVLDLDPSNVDAITIKSKIERHRSEKQLGTWFQLVRQHIDSGHFTQARQGIDEIFRISPSDARAREMLREIARREQEDQQIQTEKERLYEAALANYRGGEISTAMNKLERALELARQARGTTPGGTDAQYQALYKQIRQEYELAQEQYRQGRQLLEAREYAKVIALCEAHLAKGSGDPLFQALKLEAEEMERQEQAAAIGDVNHRLDSETDLERKLHILEEASERYPKEPHFKQSLKLLRDRRDLVSSIVARGRQFEDRGQFNESIAQLEIVRNIYPQYPGLEDGLQRLRGRLEDTERESLKAKRMSEFDSLLSSGDYTEARRAASEALAKFPGDREIEGLLKLADEGIDRCANAQRRLEQGQSLCARGDYTGALPLLREAAQLDDGNAAIRAALMGALLERARAAMDRDWHEAEPLVNEALKLSQNDPVALSLAALSNDHKAREAVSGVLLEVRELQASGNATGALLAVERGLAVFPRDQRLRQLELTLHSTLGIPVRRDAGVSEASDQTQGPAVAESTVTKEPVNETVVRPSTSTAPSPEVSAPEAGTPPPPPPSGNKPPPPPGTPRPSNGATTILPSPKSGDGTKVAGKRKGPPYASMAVAAGIVLVAAAFSVMQFMRKPPPPTIQAPIGQVPVEVSANITGAHFTLDGQPVTSSPALLKPGRHQLAASLDGYLPFSQVLDIPADQQGAKKVGVNLIPAPAEIRIASALKNGQAIVDTKAISLQEGNLILGDLSPGDHTLKIVESGKELVSLTFSFQPATLVDLHGPVQAKDFPAVVVSSLGQSAKVWASAGLKGGRGAGPSRPIAPEGLALENVAPGHNDFVVDDGKNSHTLAIDATTAPVLSVWLGSERATGTVVVRANVPDAKVVVNGVALKRPMANGVRIISLEPSVYRVKIVSPGFQDSAEQTVEIRQGDSKSLQFELLPVIRKGLLALDKFPADAEVLIDGSKVGTTGNDGTFRTEVIAGSHTLAFRKNGYEETSVTRDFKADATVALSGDILTRIPGSLTFRVTPASAKISYRREGEPQPHDGANGQTVSLRPGTYEVTAEAEKYKSRSQSVTIQSGKTSLVEWTLATVEKHETNNGRTIANTFEAPGAWTVSDGWWHHIAPDFGWFRLNQGKMTLDILRQSTTVVFIRKSKRVEWDVDYQNEGNRIAYALDEHQLHRKAFVDGVAGPEIKTGHGMENLKVYRVGIEISPERIIIRNRAGKVLDEYARPKPEAPLGKFGFRGEVALSIAELR